jgi:predicted AAA+ superfamily ATPase
MEADLLLRRLARPQDTIFGARQTGKSTLLRRLTERVEAIPWQAL